MVEKGPNTEMNEELLGGGDSQAPKLQQRKKALSFARGFFFALTPLAQAC